MNFELVTMSGVKLNEEIYEAMIPTTEGEIAVFPGHEALITIAEPGAVAVRHRKGDGDEKLSFYAISGGVVEVSNTYIRLLVDTAEHDDEIDEKIAKEALDRAVEMRGAAVDAVDLEQHARTIHQQQARLKVAGLRRRYRNR